jgi:hypothetical protein
MTNDKSKIANEKYSLPLFPLSPLSPLFLLASHPNP